MLKFCGCTDDGTPMIGIGLSEENIKRLKKGKPLRFDAQGAGWPFKGKFLVVYGETEEKIAKDLGIPVHTDAPIGKTFITH